ncbi:MAG TPA: ABC transporter ATP-binding protein/permease [Polyangiaceae bacterium]
MKRKHGRAKNFDRRLWHRFWSIAKPYWFLDARWTARGMLLLLVVLLFGRTEFTVLFNQQSGEFTSALAARDSARFWHSMRIFGAVLAIAVPIYAFYYFVRDKLGIVWRRWLTARFLGRYFKDRAYYELTSNHAIDNPDQRIADDINSFTTKSLTFLLEVIGAVLQLVAFSGILWSISRLMVGFLVVYALIGTGVTFGVFGKPLINLNFQQLRREADFRFSLIRIRENAEAIAFYRGEARESAHVLERFGELFRNYNRLLKRTLGLNLFQYGYSFVTYILPSLIIAPRVLSGELEVGRVVQASGAFTAMLSSLTIFVDNFETLSGFAAGIERLHSFSKSLVVEPPSAHADSTIARAEQPSLELRSLTLQTPNRERTLLTDVSVQVPAGQGLLIVGASGGGKSSLLRAIAGLWNAGTGQILRPKLEEMLFLPQRPYMILGTLRTQLLYPNIEREIPDDELHAVLEQVNLTGIVERCGGFDAELDFAKVLSVGEQQRLAIARVLLTKPRYVVLDEATSALDEKNEAVLYAELVAEQSTLVSVTHHPGLVKYHRQVLELTGDGSWTLRKADGYQSEDLPPRSRDERAAVRARGNLQQRSPGKSG